MSRTEYCWLLEGGDDRVLTVVVVTDQDEGDEDPHQHCGYMYHRWHRGDSRCPGWNLDAMPWRTAEQMARAA